MKKYIIVNKYTNNNQIGGNNNFKILSWNVSWEAMTSSLAGQFKICSKNKISCNHNIITNIYKTIKKFKPDIMGFQEAAKYNDIIDLIDTKIYDYFLNKSGQEDMLTIWNKNIFSLIIQYHHEFRFGRPFCIFILKHKQTNQIICLINIHAGHEPNTQESIFLIINKFIEDKLDKKLAKKISRVIMFGDFNRNPFDDKTYNYEIIIENNVFNLHRDDLQENTCCNIKGKKNNANYDHVLDSKYMVKRQLVNKEKYYTIPASDHVMIIGKVKI
jgi:hypothetical protein